MTTANKVTILRILLIPFFVVQILYYFSTGRELHWILALVAFALAAILDGVDGYIARRFNQKSELGAILDPLADKLLLVSALVLLSVDSHGYLQTIPLWFTVTVISRDVLLVIGVLVVFLICGHVPVRPRWAGKVATVLQMITVVWTMMKWSPAWFGWWALSAAVLTLFAGFQYLYDGMQQLSASPRSGPSPGPKK